MTHAYENITLPQTSFVGGKKHLNTIPFISNTDKKNDDHSSQGSADSDDFTDVTAEIENSESLQSKTEVGSPSDPENLSAMGERSTEGSLRLRTGFASSSQV